MKILTVDNTVYEIDQVPDEIDDIRFGVFDTSDPEWMDYYFLPLIFLESFYAPAICLQIGEHTYFSGHFSPIRLGLKGFLLCSKATGGLDGPVRAPGSWEPAPPPGSLGLQSLVPRPKVKSQKCQKNPKCQKHHKIFF